MFGFLEALLSVQGGAVNSLLQSFGIEPIAFVGSESWFRPMFIASSVWKEAGWGTILYLAAISGINPEQYEAAIIDGAGPWQRFAHITLPLLTPYALFLWIMGTIGALQIFTQAYLIAMPTNGNSPGDSLLFYALYLFQRAFRYFEMGYASAMAWFATRQEWGGGPIEYQTVSRRHFAGPKDANKMGSYMQRGAY